MPIITSERSDLLRCTELDDQTLNNLPSITEQQSQVLCAMGEGIKSCMAVVAEQLMQVAGYIKAARAAVDDGNWRVWLYQQGFSYRTAMQYIQTAERFGGKEDKVANIRISCLYKMLPLPAGDVDGFLEEHDVAAMTARETGEAVKEWNEEHKPKQQSIDLEAMTAQARREGVEDARKEYAEQIADMRKQVGEVETLRGQAQSYFDSLTSERDKVSKLEESLQEKDAMIDMLQEQHDKRADESLGEKLQSIHSDPGGYEERPISSAFAWDVHAFVGQHASLPHQYGKFASMTQGDKDTMREAIREMRKHLDAVERMLNTEEAVAL